jgi:formylglycine-generating enzyme required for sulfatase activity
VDGVPVSTFADDTPGRACGAVRLVCRAGASATLKEVSIQELSPAASGEELRSPATGMRLVRIGPGEFTMGWAPRKPGGLPNEHRVRITEPFSLGTHEVTQVAYRTVMGSTPTHFANRDANPVEDVTWDHAVRFCNALSVREGLPPFYWIEGEAVGVPDWNAPGYRLPTEAEWEYAARAGSDALRPFGDDPAVLLEHGWFLPNSGDSTQPVGLKTPNAWGLRDTLGNVWEWCWDVFDPEYYLRSPAEDPTGPEARPDSRRVFRGYGSVDEIPSVAHRNSGPPDGTYFTVGFRVARNASPGR